MRPPPFPLMGHREIGSAVSDKQMKRLGKKLRRMAGTEQKTANIAVTMTILTGLVESGGKCWKRVNGQ